MSSYSGYDPYEYLGGTPRKKRTPYSGTVGSVVPVTRMTNPYTSRLPYSQSPTSASSLVSMLGQQNAFNQSQKAIPSTTLTPDFNSDPILMQIRALGTQNVQNAQSNAAALRKQAVIESGVQAPNLGVDDATLQAAGQNQGSALARLQAEAASRESDLETALNQQNLFYSGHRANKLSDLGRSRALAEGDISSELMSALAQINRGVTEAQTAETAREQEMLARQAEITRQQEFERSLYQQLADQQAAAEAAAQGYRTDASQWMGQLTESQSQLAALADQIRQLQNASGQAGYQGSAPIVAENVGGDLGAEYYGPVSSFEPPPVTPEVQAQSPDSGYVAPPSSGYLTQGPIYDFNPIPDQPGYYEPSPVYYPDPVIAPDPYVEPDINYLLALAERDKYMYG